MAIAARVYVLKRGAGVLATTSEILNQVTARLEPMRASGEIQGFLARVCRDAEDLEYDGFDEEEVLGASGTGYPVTWLNVTYNPATFDSARLASIEQEFDCVLIRSGESD